MRGGLTIRQNAPANKPLRRIERPYNFIIAEIRDKCLPPSLMGKGLKFLTVHLYNSYILMQCIFRGMPEIRKPKSGLPL